MVTVLSMNKKERKRAKRASLPRNQVYLKVIYLSVKLQYTFISLHVENVILSVFISLEYSLEYTDSTGIDLEEFLITTLKSSPR